jgi:hypothetical protein
MLNSTEILIHDTKCRSYSYYNFHLKYLLLGVVFFSKVRESFVMLLGLSAAQVWLRVFAVSPVSYGKFRSVDNWRKINLIFQVTSVQIARLMYTAFEDFRIKIYRLLAVILNKTFSF